ncbi:MAG: four helix bundle protein [Candidatus Azobacteroides sp.]|nr:four helix bundle protein [Candidatus Azobacteroides sp.]
MGENLVKSFEDLTVWKDSMQLVVLIYSKLRNCKDYGFKDQIQRASVSIPSNIAEGFERQTNKEFIQFLFIAKGSCGELQTQLYLSIKLEYLSKIEGQEFIDKAKKISSMIYNLISYRKTIK